MATQHLLRRPAYGSTSPDVGSLGARTRLRIAQSALECFTEKGFHATVVEDIASHAGVSRATLYQYFESKEALFLELIQEGGADFLLLARSARPLGPDRQGFEDLRSWLRNWAEQVDRYAALFVEWANVNSRQAPLRPRLAWFVECHTSVWSTRLSEAGFEGLEPETMALLTLAVAERYNYSRLVFGPRATTEQLVDNLAVAFQLALFPQTRRSILVSAHAATRLPPEVRPHAAPARRRPKASVADVSPAADRIQGLSDQAANTVRQLLDAAARVFADHGYAATNVDLIVTEAGLARGTFYKYFKAKSDLLAALTEECTAKMLPALQEFGTLAKSTDPSGDLHAWLVRFLHLQQTYSAVMRAWTERQPDDPRVMARRDDVVTELTHATRQLLDAAGRSDLLAAGATAMLVAALLERFPEESMGTRFHLAESEIVDAQALFLGRILFRPPRAVRRPG